MTKKSTLIVLAVVLMLTMSFSGLTTAFASETDEPDNSISPKMTYISTIMPCLSFSGSTALLNCEVRGIYGTTTKITVTGTLQKSVSGSWVNVYTGSQTSNNYRMTYTRSTSATKGYSYRAKYLVKAYSGSAYETRTVYSKTVKLP